MTTLLQSSHVLATQNCNFPNPVTPLSMFIVFALQQNGTAQFVCSDSIGTKYQSLPARHNAPNSITAQVFFGLNVQSIANTVTVVDNQSPGGLNPSAIAVHEFSLVSQLDVNQFAVGTGLVQDSGTAFTRQASALLFGYEAASTPLGQQAVSSGVGWTSMESDPFSFLTQYQIVSIAGGYDSTTSTVPAGKSGVVNWVEEIIAFFDNEWQVGEIYQNDGTKPGTVQPGGPGTIVTMPQETDGEKLGLFVAGCGHFFVSFVAQSASVFGVPACLLLCPVCNYIQRIIVPFTDIYSESNFILFG